MQQQDQTIPLASVPTAFGTPFEGGFYAGRFRIDGKLCVNVAAGAEGDLEEAEWSEDFSRVVGAASYVDGLANTRAMADAGYDLAIKAIDARIGGFDDWHIPARDGLELCYRYLKPTTYFNPTWRSGENPSSVPPGYPYTAESPQQTASPAFLQGAPDAFREKWYWTSTQYAYNDVYAWAQDFSGGYQGTCHKDDELRVRLVRRVLVIE